MVIIILCVQWNPINQDVNDVETVSYWHVMIRHEKVRCEVRHEMVRHEVRHVQTCGQEMVRHEKVRHDQT